MSRVRPAHPSRRRARRLRAPRWLLAATGALLLAAPAPALADAGNDKTVCAYTNHSLAGLQAFDAMIHRDLNCAMVYNNAAPDWSNWENPWFLRNTGADSDFKDWATAPGANRRVIITQDLFPRALDNTAWRAPAAAGAYLDHARALARNLVAAGLGGATIRLAHEANGIDYPHNVGNTPADFAQWVQIWRKTAIAMKSVPGAHFLFDWCILAQVRAIPLAQFYPGDDVVDIIGIDAYDTGTPAPAGAARWTTVYGRTEGIGDVVNFAKAHNKPLSIPEWGVSPKSNAQGGGDDPAYVDGIADVVRRHRVSYQSYFNKYAWATQLAGGPASLAAYIRHFSSTGDSGPGSVAPADPAAAAERNAHAASNGSRALGSLANSTAEAAMASLVAGGKLRKAASVMVDWHAAGTGTACVLALAAPAHAAPKAMAKLIARARSRCATRAWRTVTAGKRVLAFGTRALVAGHRTAIALRYRTRGPRRMRPGTSFQLNVVAIVVPHGASAVARSRHRAVRAG